MCISADNRPLFVIGESFLLSYMRRPILSDQFFLDIAPNKTDLFFFESCLFSSQNHSLYSPCRFRMARAVLTLVTVMLLMLGGCAKSPVGRMMETTAYCGCSSCCSWERGSWHYLKLDFWNRYVSAGSQAGRPYSGLTAKGTSPQESTPGLFSMDSVERPWMIPLRILPWSWLQEDGTIAADTRYYPFGTRMYVPGYGWGRVEDRGGDIKGRDRIDLYFDSHTDALLWGRKKIQVQIEGP